MRNAIGAALGVFLGLAGMGNAQSAERPVVVELYTSQGCSSCPPADEVLGELAPRDDVIALALHVDYWDYIGWKDKFGNPNHTRRQRAYARAAGARTIYTPQMIIGGMDHLVGVRPMELADAIRVQGSKPAAVTLNIVRNGAKVHIEAQANGGLKRTTVVQVVRYTPEETVSIERGENAGRVLSYSNIVTSWTPIAEWDGRSALVMDAAAEGNQPTVVIVQEEGAGPILAAARLR
jgi:hypothetical protein